MSLIRHSKRDTVDMGTNPQAHNATFRFQKAVTKCFAGMISGPRSVVLYASGVFVALDTARQKVTNILGE